MNPRSLRLRLLVLAAASLVFVLIVAGLALSAIFAAHTQRMLEARLLAELDRVVALVDATPAQPALRRPMPDARYETPAGGIYWQMRDAASGSVARSRSLWDVVLQMSPAPVGAESVTTPSMGPDGQRVLVVSQSLVFDRASEVSRRLEVSVAEDLSDVEAANASFQSDLIRSLGVLAIVLMATSWATIELGLAPLSRIKLGISRIRSGARKSLAGDYPSEVMPLVTEVNELLGLQERSIEFARDRAADLAHGLKTSLTLLNGEAFELQVSGNVTAARRIEQLTSTMTETIDHQLRLSRLRHRVRADRQSTALGKIARKVAAAVKATPAGRQREWTIEVEDTQVAMDQMDLSELLGIVLENAAQWAMGTVNVQSELRTDRVTVTVIDDGPGIDDSVLARLGERGHRLDEHKPGSGIGLAIAHEIASLNSAKLAFSRPTMGGLAVSIEIPLAM